MILIWSDIKSFQRHLEAMRSFRQYHGANPIDRLLIKDMPIPYDIIQSQKDRLITCLTDIRSKVIFVPIWKMTVPPGSQN